MKKNMEATIGLYKELYRDNEKRYGNYDLGLRVWDLPLVSWEWRDGKEKGNHYNGLYRDYYRRIDSFIPS